MTPLKKMVDEFDVKYLAFWEMNTKKPVPGWDGRKAYGYGSTILSEVFEPELQTMKKAVEKLHEVTSQVKAAPYSHCFFQGLEKESDTTFKDSWVTDSSGKRCASVYNRKTHVNYQTIYPTLTNSFGKAYRRIIEMYLKDVNIDWLYWDESNGPGMTASDNASAASSTYNAWDGHTAEIDPKTNTIIRKYGILPLISNSFIISIADIFRKKGSFVLFNGAASTKERMMFPCMTEAQDDFSRIYTLHLCSPLAYSIAKLNIKTIRKYIQAGAILIKNRMSAETGTKALSKCYPLTIMEIRPGWIKAKERVITSKSGDFGWDGKFSAKVYRYDKNDKMLDKPEVKHYNDYVNVTVPDEGLVIIEKADK